MNGRTLLGIIKGAGMLFLVSMFFFADSHLRSTANVQLMGYEAVIPINSLVPNAPTLVINNSWAV